MFGDLLKMVTQRAAKDAVANGGKALPPGMLKPSQVSGSTFANILGFVSDRKTRGIQDIYQSTVDMITKSRERADKQLATLISTGAIANLDNISLDKLASLTDYPLEYLQSIKKAKQEEKKSTSKLTDFDRIADLNNYLSDKIGDVDGKISAKTYMAAYKRWIGLNGAINDFQYAYPVEEWLGEWEYKNLPEGWRPKKGPEVEAIRNLPADVQVTIKQIQDLIDRTEEFELTDEEGEGITYDQALRDFPDWAVYLNPAK